MKNALGFSAADILLPQNCDLTKWAVVACDQYTSQPEYWTRVDAFVGDAPSTLRFILPESKLESDQVAAEIQSIHQAMTSFLQGGQFQTLPHTLIYVQRKLDNGAIRQGLIGQVDLEQYSYAVGAQTPIRATEGTVLSRIPPRMAVRQEAPIELPHIMVLIDDPEKTVIEPLQREVGKMAQLYDFELMEHGGHMTGWALDENQQAPVLNALQALSDPNRFAQFYHAPGKAPLVFAIGDGNHSLATAKACWEEKKKELPQDQWDTHPARYALVELGNLHDPSLEFEAIHRVVFNVNPENLLDALQKAYPGVHAGTGEGHTIKYLYGDQEGTLTIPNPEAQLAVGTLQKFLDAYLEKHGGKVDYIHGEEVVRQLAKETDSIGFLLPAMTKEQLFPTVIFDGALPRKTFSMGEAHDKRYYLEARIIL